MLANRHYYNQTLKKSVAVFGTVFNNLRVVKHGGTEERVPISYGPRQKFLARLEQASRQDSHFAIKVPRMAFEIRDLSYDTNASLSKMNKLCYPTDDTGIAGVLRQSVSYILSMELNIISKTQDEALQIVEQILPMFTPEYTVAITDMHGPGKSCDVPIVLTDVTLNDEYEADFETRKVIVYTLNFTMKIRFYGLVESNRIIHNITADLYNDSTVESAIDPVDRVETGVTKADATPNNFDTINTFGFDNEDDWRDDSPILPLTYDSP